MTTITITSRDGGPVRLEHAFPLNPTYGYSPEALRELRPEIAEPADFDAFWRGLKARADGAAAETTFREVAGGRPGFRVVEIGYTVWPDYRVGGWAILPEVGAIRRGLVVGHGYGGRAEPDLNYAADGVAVLQPVAPGFGPSADARLPLNDCMRHVVHGIDDPETYVLGSCAAVFWRAPEVLDRLCGGRLEEVRYEGGSFGGGMGALMLPWTERYASAMLELPTFGWHDFRLSQPCVGSGDAVRRRFSERPGIRRTLEYFDAAAAAKRIRTPVAFGCALFDPAVPPPGQFAVANLCAGPKRITELVAGHVPDEHEFTLDERKRLAAAAEEMASAVRAGMTNDQ